MLSKFLAKAREKIPTPKLPDQAPEVEAALADIQATSELAAAAAVLGDWASVYRHRAKLPALQARLRKAMEVPV